MEKGLSFVKPENNDFDSHNDVNCDDDDEGWAEEDALPPPHPSATEPPCLAFASG